MKFVDEGPRARAGVLRPPQSRSKRHPHGKFDGRHRQGSFAVQSATLDIFRKRPQLAKDLRIARNTNIKSCQRRRLQRVNETCRSFFFEFLFFADFLDCLENHVADTFF